MKRGSKISLVIVISLFTIISLTNFCIADDFGEETTTPTTDTGLTASDPQDAAIADPTITVTEATDDTPQTYDLSESTTDITVNEIPNDIAITTNEGTISQFSMSNALFSLGSLIQGSFISFSNNNQLFFGSLFDASTFVATLDNSSSIEIGQRSSFGDMGKIVIAIDGQGNLTQDENIIFIPQGNEPTYIYYNSTQIEFKDGNISLLGESLTNTDESKETSIVFFDETGFTKIELKQENTYTIFDYSIQNTGEENLIICKENPLCDINIDQAAFTIKGKINFSANDEVIYSSSDENNIFNIDTATGIASLENSRPQADSTAELYSGNFEIQETAEQTLYRAQNKSRATAIKRYTSFHQENPIDLQQSSLSTTDHASFTSEYTEYSTCLESNCPLPKEQEQIIQQSPENPNTSIFYSVLSILVILLLVLYLTKRNKLKKKGQMSLFILLGLVLLAAVILFFVFTQSNSTEDIAKIESLTDASTAIQNCIEETIQDKVFLWGLYGGTTETNRYSFSSFNTNTELLSLEELQQNLQTGLERSLNDCKNILEGTSYTLESNGRTQIEIVMEQELEIKVSSLGEISDGQYTEAISETEERFAINMPEMYTFLTELKQDWTPLLSNEEYTIRTFYNEDFSEKLIQITDKDTEFVFQITSVL
jgi:hypothetical protein